MDNQLKYREVAERVIAGEISQQMGANILGVPRSTLMMWMNRDYPDRPKGVNIRKENRTPVSGRPRKVTYLEVKYTDETLCRDLACRNCPLNVPGEKCKSSEGWIKAMLQKLPLKREQKPLEETT